jgi:hypothetical protein
MENAEVLSQEPDTEISLLIRAIPRGPFWLRCDNMR